MTNLTHAEAQARTQALNIDNYAIHLDFSTDDDTFKVQTAISFSTTAERIFLDYLGQSVESVRVDGGNRPVDFRDGRIWLDVTAGEVVVEVEGTSRYSRSGQGMHRMVDNADGNVYLYSHLEPSDARRIFPCFDQPDLKASFNTSITAPEGWTVLSNQPEVSRDGNTVHFAPTPRLSTYLTAFAAGPYIVKTLPWREIELRAFARASMADYLDDEILQITAQGMDFFDEHFGFPYPWGKYDSIFVPEYNLGAMENPGLVTFTETYLFRSRATRAQRANRTNTILHEMSHMWFGDLVTPQWWDDLWLKESFAEFMGADASEHATEYAEAWVNFAGIRKNWAYTQDQMPTTHPIKAEIPDVDAARQNFDGITYAKGAAVLKQLVHYIGRDKFYAGARDYFQKFAFSSATFAELLECLKHHTDRDLDAWAQAWLLTTGPDTLTPVIDGGTLTITSEPGLRPHRLNVSFFDEELNRYETRDVDLGEKVDGIGKPALVVLNDGDHTYAKVRFDETSLKTLRTGLSRIGDELTRAVVWTALWQATRDAVLAPADYVQMVLDHAPKETNPGLLTTAFANAQYAVEHFYDDPTYADRVWDLLADAAEGSDAQLVFTRAAIPVVAPERLRELLATNEDPDIRWSVLRALAARDAVEVSELEAERERDNTLTGAAAFLGARYAYPECKREVFDLVQTPGAYSNDEVDHLLAAFNAPGSAKLREEFTEEFFAGLKKLWEAHPIEIANRLVRGLYPEDTREVEVNGALRRVVLECRDIVARNQHVRQNAQ